MQFHYGVITSYSVLKYMINLHKIYTYKLSSYSIADSRLVRILVDQY